MTFLLQTRTKVIGIVLLALFCFLVFFRLDTNPGFWFDEGLMAQIAKNLARSGVYGIQTEPDLFHTDIYWVTVNYPVTIPAAVSQYLFGHTIVSTRLPNALYLFGFLLCTALLIFRMYGIKAAFWVIALLVTFNPLYGNGKALLGETPGLFWIIAGLYAAYRFSETSTSRYFYMTALFFGLAVSTKPFYSLWIIAVMLLLYLLYRAGKVTGTQIILFMLLFSIPVGIWILVSLGTYVFTHPITSLSYFTNSYAVDSFVPDIAQNMLRFFTETTPLHFLLFAFAGAYAFAAVRSETRQQNIILPVCAFVLVSFIWYLKTPGWYRYFYSIHLLVIIFSVPLVLAYRPRFAPWILSCVLLVQGVYLVTHYTAYASDEVQNVARYLESVSDHGPVFVDSKPEVAYLIENSRLFQYIYINTKLQIGRPLHEIPPPAYVVTGRDTDLFESKGYTSLPYVLEREIGHYRIYKNTQS